jgi:hypothetical protein
MLVTIQNIYGAPMPYASSKEYPLFYGQTASIFTNIFFNPISVMSATLLIVFFVRRCEKNVQIVVENCKKSSCEDKIEF